MQILGHKPFHLMAIAAKFFYKKNILLLSFQIMGIIIIFLISLISRIRVTIQEAKIQKPWTKFVSIILQNKKEVNKQRTVSKQ